MVERGNRKNKIVCWSGVNSDNRPMRIELTLMIVRAIVCGKEKTIFVVSEVEDEKTPFLKERRCLSMDLRNVRALGEGIMVDVHGHKLSGAAKMTYIVYWFGKMVDDLDPTLIKQGREYASEILMRIA